MGVGKLGKFSTVFAVVLTLCFSLMAGVVAHAQVTGATLSGTITDPSGAVVSGASVSIKNNATGESRSVTTDSAGLFNAPNLTPGVYEVRISAAGFATAVQSGVALSVGQSQQLNLSLKVGDTTTTVQVTEAAPQIDLTSSALSGQVESETVRELPLNGRDWTSLAVLQPGVKTIETQMSYSTSARGNRGFGGELTVSGQRSTFNNYRIDGISVNDYAMAAPGNVIGVVLGVDAIQEFSVLTGGFPAEYGRATGGIINAISRQGTNQLHGAIYEFLRNNAFDANDYFTRSAGNPIPPFRATSSALRPAHRSSRIACSCLPITKVCASPRAFRRLRRCSRTTRVSQTSRTRPSLPAAPRLPNISCRTRLAIRQELLAPLLREIPEPTCPRFLTFARTIIRLRFWDFSRLHRS